MPLRRTKIGLEAALRRVTKALKVAAGESMKASFARKTAHESKVAAEAAIVASEEAAAASEAAVVSAESAMSEAVGFLEYCKANCIGSEEGSFWWMDRELEEAKKYMPKSKLAKLAATPRSP